MTSSGRFEETFQVFVKFWGVVLLLASFKQLGDTVTTYESGLSKKSHSVLHSKRPLFIKTSFIGGPHHHTTRDKQRLGLQRLARQRLGLNQCAPVITTALSYQKPPCSYYKQAKAGCCSGVTPQTALGLTGQSSNTAGLNLPTQTTIHLKNSP